MDGYKKTGAFWVREAGGWKLAIADSTQKDFPFALASFDGMSIELKAGILSVSSKPTGPRPKIPMSIVDELRRACNALLLECAVTDPQMKPKEAPTVLQKTDGNVVRVDFSKRTN